jgi:hypothetical protein
VILGVDDFEGGWGQCQQLDEVQITSSMMLGDFVVV